MWHVETSLRHVSCRKLSEGIRAVSALSFLPCPEIKGSILKPMKPAQIFSLTIGSLRWLFLPILCLFVQHVEAEIVTLVLSKNGTTLPATNQLQVKAGQVAKVISFSKLLN